MIFFEDEQKHYVTLFMVADRTTGEARLKEPDKCEGWDWFRWSELPEPHFLPVANLLAQNFSSGLPSWPPGPSSVTDRERYR